MSSYKEEFLMMGLEKMFKGPRFDICTVRELATLLGTGSIPRDMEAEFSILHCVGYADIPKPIRDGLPRRVVEALSYSTPPGVELNVEDILQELLKRLRSGYHQEEGKFLPSQSATEEIVGQDAWTFKSFFKIRR